MPQTGFPTMPGLQAPPRAGGDRCITSEVFFRECAAGDDPEEGEVQASVALRDVRVRPL